MFPTNNLFLLRKVKPEDKISFHADMARGSEERPSRSQEPLSPDFPETSEVWNAAQVAAHGRLFPFSDNFNNINVLCCK